MSSWTRDPDGNWTDETAEIDRDDQNVQRVAFEIQRF